MQVAKNAQLTNFKPCFKFPQISKTPQFVFLAQLDRASPPKYQVEHNKKAPNRPKYRQFHARHQQLIFKKSPNLRHTRKISISAQKDKIERQMQKP